MESKNGLSGSSKAAQIIEAYQDGLFRFAYYRTGSFATAQDIVQDVLLKFLRNINTSHIIQLKPYLYRSVANACTDYRRKEKGHFLTTLESASTLEADKKSIPGHNLIIQQEFERINLLLGKLPEEQAEVLRMRIIDELAFDEIAQLLSVSLSTAKSRFKYGLDKLKIIVKDKNILK